jgi:hypothetical protein
MMLATSLRIALVLIASCPLFTGAYGQNDPEKPAASACPSAQQIKAPQIYGQWRVRFNPAPAGLPADATMQLERHAQFSDSLAGSVSRDLPRVAGGHAPRAQLAGDLEDGFLILDESSNGTSITGTWNGEMVEGSCGRKFTGTWKDTRDSAPPDAPGVPFTLEKVSGW